MAEVRPPKIDTCRICRPAARLPRPPATAGRNNPPPAAIPNTAFNDLREHRLDALKLAQSKEALRWPWRKPKDGDAPRACKLGGVAVIVTRTPSNSWAQARGGARSAASPIQPHVCSLATPSPAATRSQPLRPQASQTTHGRACHGWPSRCAAQRRQSRAPHTPRSLRRPCPSHRRQSRPERTRRARCRAQP